MGEERLSSSDRTKLVKGLVERFGHEQKYIRAKMGDCDDVPRFLANLEKAHQQTAKSTLRFGPESSKLSKDDS